MTIQFLIDSYRNQPTEYIVADVVEVNGEKTFTVRDEVLQKFLTVNEKTMAGFAKELEQRGSRRYHWVSKQDYDHPEEAIQRYADYILGKTKSFS
ncbi:hypothetical protein COB21_04405 [Candidatus Aerophobetes bacterium]|uniref:Uncharacterized protein n=1 Tax=Aerophobetes bacterium TaxID=2030807 RepID=A0A2A4X348_UNCAE|nr:MAG: hypothetical protein COB21_04405 [Candidatus Aerophobetes bacterium]